ALERAVLERLGRELGEPRGGVGLEREAEQRAEVGVEPELAVADERRERAPERDANPQLGIVRARPEPLAQEVAAGPVRHRLAVGDAASLEPEGRPLGAALARRGLQLRQEAALADPGLAAQEEDAAGSGEHLDDGLARPLELRLATHDRRALTAETAHAPGQRPRPQHLVRG